MADPDLYSGVLTSISQTLRQADRGALCASSILKEEFVFDGVAPHHPAALGWDDFNGSH